MIFLNGKKRPQPSKCRPARVGASGPEANPRLDPEQRLCPKFDPVSAAKFTVAKPGEMGVRVVDDCAEEHIM